jgi:hypothetical protein
MQVRRVKVKNKSFDQSFSKVRVPNGISKGQCPFGLESRGQKALWSPVATGGISPAIKGAPSDGLNKACLAAFMRRHMEKKRAAGTWGIRIIIPLRVLLSLFTKNVL